jgi:hypothetical protein
MLRVLARGKKMYIHKIPLVVQLKYQPTKMYIEHAVNTKVA